MSLHLGLVTGWPPVVLIFASPNGRPAETLHAMTACRQSMLQSEQSSAFLKHKAKPRGGPGDTVLCVLCLLALQKLAYFSEVLKIQFQGVPPRRKPQRANQNRS